MRRYGILLPLLLTLAALGALASSSSPRKARLFLLQGMQREVQGDLPGAYTLYRHALASDPADRLARYKAGMLETLRGDSASVAQGLADMREYVEAYPADYYEALTYANLRARAGDHAEAWRVTRRLHTLYPRNTELLNTLAELAMYLQMPDTALEYLSQEERVEGTSTYLTTCKMMAHLSRGDTAATLREADEALRRNPADPDYYILKGGALDNFDRRDSALRYYELADSLFPGRWNVKRALAMHYAEAGDSAAMQQAMQQAMLAEDADLEEKIEMFTSYVAPMLMEDKGTDTADHLMEALEEQYPYEPQMRYIQAQYTAAKGDLSKAADQITIAVDMDPASADYRLLQVQYLTGAARYAEAVKAYEEAPADQARSIPLMPLVAASAYQGAGMYTQALAAVDTLLHDITGSDTPDSLSLPELSLRLNDKGLTLFGDAMAEKGNILFLMDRPGQAVSAYDKALQIDPDDPMLLNNCAFFMAKAGLDLPRAAEMSLKSVTAEPDNPVYLDTYAYILFRRHNYGDALTYMEKALSLADAQPTPEPSAEYYEHYGDILSRLGQTAKAVEMWEKALSLDPAREILKQKIKTKAYIDE